MADQIKKVVLKDGRTRYRFVVDIGRDPETGKRQQKTYTYNLQREAREALAEIRSATAKGTYVRPSKMTLNEHLDEWLPAVLRGSARGKGRALTDATARNYADALQPARDRLGHKQLQAITKADVEKLVTWMLTSGRKRGGKPGTGLSGRSVGLTLGRLTAALEMAVKEGKLVRNPAALVEPPPHEKRERKAWTVEQVHKFLAVATADRLHAAWRLSLYGLRRGRGARPALGGRRVGLVRRAVLDHGEQWCAPCYRRGERLPARPRCGSTPRGCSSTTGDRQGPEVDERAAHAAARRRGGRRAAGAAGAQARREARGRRRLHGRGVGRRRRGRRAGAPGVVLRRVRAAARAGRSAARACCTRRGTPRCRYWRRAACRSRSCPRGPGTTTRGSR